MPNPGTGKPQLFELYGQVASCTAGASGGGGGGVKVAMLASGGSGEELSVGDKERGGCVCEGFVGGGGADITGVGIGGGELGGGVTGIGGEAGG